MARHAAHLPVTRICGLLDVARSGYYAWHERPTSARQRANEELLTRIREVHTDSHNTYGSPRVHAALKAEGEGCSVGRVERLMRENEVRAKARGGFVPTTTRPGGAYFPAGNVLDRRFAPGGVAALVADITGTPASMTPMTHVQTMSEPPTCRATRRLATNSSTTTLPFLWRNRMFAALIAQRDETIPEETLLGLSSEFFMQIEWLPGGRIDEGELIFDPAFPAFV